MRISHSPDNNALRKTADVANLLNVNVMKNNKKILPSIKNNYKTLISEIGDILKRGRKLAYQTVNAVLTTTYWQIGRQIVEFEQGGKERAEYGEIIIKQLSVDLTDKFGKGFSQRNLQQIKKFYITFPKAQTP
ncbi:hypothetical protein KKE99_02365, partial [Patescibacteria group bacterium]|nr:hypothetical protein [Patescibacteria group bacterium]